VKPKAFLDCDILLDVLAQRGKFYAPAAQLLSLGERGRIQTYTSALAALNVHYVLRRFTTVRDSREALKRMLSLVSVLPVDAAVIDEALACDFADLEDAVQYCVARRARVGFLVTRNVGDYRTAQITVCTPDQYLRMLASGSGKTQESEGSAR
jgi:predicted nucleic acid-binding protein